MKNKGIKLRRININVPEELIEEIKKQAIKVGIPYTHMLIIILRRGLNENI